MDSIINVIVIVGGNGGGSDVIPLLVITITSQCKY